MRHPTARPIDAEMPEQLVVASMQAVSDTRTLLTSVPHCSLDLKNGQYNALFWTLLEVQEGLSSIYVSDDSGSKSKNIANL